MLRTTATLVLIVLAGCSTTSGPEPDYITFTTRTHVAVVGDTLVAVLANSSPSSVAYDFCPVSLERRTDRGWTTVQNHFGSSDGPVCIAMRYSLPGGAEAAFRQLVPPNLTPDVYRLRTTIFVHDRTVTVYSSEFRIM